MREREYEAWVKSHTPDQIRMANLARNKLRTKAGIKYGAKWPLIKDDRLLVQPSSSYALFLGDRMATGDFRHISLGDATRLIAGEWKSLDEGQKKVIRSCNCR